MTNQATPWLFTLEKMPKADELFQPPFQESYTNVVFAILRIEENILLCSSFERTQLDRPNVEQCGF